MSIRKNGEKCTVLSVLSAICEDASVSFPEAVPGFEQVAMDTGVRLAMQAAEKGVADGTLFEYLKRFKKQIRHHFNRNALALCPDRRTAAAVLTLRGSALAFWAAAALYKRIRGKRV